MLEKRKRVHLTGKKARKLHDDCFERDGHVCVCCGAWVPDGQKEHHEPCGVYKSDEIEKVVTLCYSCHQKRHNAGNESVAVRNACVSYLRGLYGEKGAVRE